MIKKIIGIGVFAYDVNGSQTLYLAGETEEMLNAGARRVTRTKTLDGGAVAYDAGYSVADLTWIITLQSKTEFTSDFVSWIVKTYNLIRISTKDGVYSAIPSRWSMKNGNVVLEALVMEKLT
jgi:hypothetical protein